MLGALLGAHSRCVCVPEMQFKLDLLRDVNSESGEISIWRLSERLRASWRFGLWGMPLEPERIWGSITHTAAGPERVRGVPYLTAVEGIVQRYAEWVGKEDPDVWIDHTPGNVRHTRELLEYFPQASIVHIVRDGRGVAASVLPLDWGPNSAYEARRWWPGWVASGLAAESRHPERVRRVHYEDILRSPKETVASICESLGLHPEEQMGIATEFGADQSALGQHPLVMRPPDPSRIEGWKTTLSPREVEIFESSTGDLLESLGYDLVFAGRARFPLRGEAFAAQVREVVLRQFNGFRFRRRVRRYTRERQAHASTATPSGGKSA
jgi:hypothetical protein